MSKKKKILLGFLCLLLALAAACLIFLSGGSYQPNDHALTALAAAEGYTITEYNDGTRAFVPEQPTAGLIFYPGGKVEAEAYAPLMAAFSQEDILCILLEMPFDLAFFDVNAADDFRELYPEIDHWYLGGHSLGGAMAAAYAAEHVEEYEGLFLLAAYSLQDLTESGLDVISLYGSEDQILNMETYEKHRSNLPQDTIEHVIPGGCHAYFSSYGPQKGDGIPNISNEEQIRITVEQCLAAIKK